MMKKSLLLISIALSTAFFAKAQNITPEEQYNVPDFRNEIIAGYGLWDNSAIMGTFSDLLVPSIATGGYTTGNHTYMGAFHLGYRYKFSRHFDLGLIYAYSRGTDDIYLGGAKVGETFNSYYSIAAEMEYRYISNDYFALYSALGLGATIYKQKYTPLDGDSQNKNKGFFDFQASLIGAKFGRQWGGFAEAGIGYKGILNFGLFARF